MVWVRLEDDIGDHPKLAAIDDHAFAIYVCGLAYCNRQLTDGFIPTGIGLTLRHCGGKTKQAITALVGARLWEVVDGGWRIHDFLDYQPSKETVQKERARSATRQSRHRRSNGVTNGVSPHGVTAAPYPVPVNSPYHSPSSVIVREGLLGEGATTTTFSSSQDEVRS